MFEKLRITILPKIDFGKVFVKRQFLLAFLLFNVLLVSAQTVTGLVTEENGDPIIGATIVEVGTNNGVVTDLDGKFSINVKSLASSLIISSLSFETKTEALNGKSNVTIILANSQTLLEEVVVVGYLPTKRENVLGAVTTLKAEQLAQVTPVSTFDAMQGRTAGVQIANNGGPGEGFDIQIRGVSTLSAGNSPLYIVDGQQLNDINNINPSDIASLEILKDGSTAAIYGSRAANGVVMITTKSGQAGKPKLEINHNTTFSNLNSGVPLANTKERLYYEGIRANRSTLPADSLNVIFDNSHDLLKLLTETGIRNVTNVGLSGVNGNVKYYWNTSFTNIDGIVLNSGYQRLNTTLKLDSDFSKKLKAGTRLGLSREKRNGLSEVAVFQQMVERIPYYPLFEPDGSYTPEIAARANPLANALFTVNDNNIYRVQTFNYMEFKPLSWLTYKVNFGGNFGLRKENNFAPSITKPQNRRDPTGRESGSLDIDYQVENLVYLKKSFNKTHNFNSVFGYTFQKWDTETYRFSATSFLSDNVETFNNVKEFNLGQTNTGKSANSLSGLFGNISYDYKNRYLVNGLIRRDGSSRFGRDNRYGYFPSLSVGWKLSNEPFMKKIDHIVSNVLLRAGFGTVGNERIGDYRSQYLLRPGSFYNGINGVAPFQLENPNLGWESTVSTNYAIDFALFKGKIDASIDVWSKDTKDLLYDVPVPAETGFTNITQNIGSIRNQGVDISLNFTPIRTKDFSWTSSPNITFFSNKVTELANPNGFEQGVGSNSGAGGPPISYKVEVGKPLGNIFGYINNGIFAYDQSNAFSPNGVQLTPIFDDAGVFSKYQLNGADYTGEIKRLMFGSSVLRGGDIIWKDLNGDFLIDGVNDRTILGNGQANIFGGWNNSFRYKALELSVLLDYSFGADIFRAYDAERDDLSSAGETPSPARINGAWVKQGDVAIYPSFDRARTWNRLANSLYVDNGDYIKVRNIRMQYRIPARAVKSTKIFDDISLNASVNNLATFTNYSGFNPELGNRGNPITAGLDRLRYPSFREVILGLIVKI